MRIEMDCVRDILLCVEENADYRKGCLFFDVSHTGAKLQIGLGRSECVPEIPDYQASLLSKYENDFLLYHVRYCGEAGLIVLNPPAQGMKEKYNIPDLTVSGHELIGKIRDMERWGKLKKLMPYIQDYSLAALTAIAEGVTTAAINACLFDGK